MQRMILLLSLVLALSIGWGNLAMAQTEADFTAAEQLAATGDVEGALKSYLALTEAHPESHEAFARLGGMQLLSQSYSDAVRSFQRSVMLGAEGPKPFIGMGMAYLHLSQYSAARAALTEAKQRSEGDTKDVDDILAWIDKRANATQH